MDNAEFRLIRKKLRKTQWQMSRLLGVSLKAVHSYEQGWRAIPPAVERHLYFLVMRSNRSEPLPPCWEIRNCPSDKRAKCPAWEFSSGDVCWLINGTFCNGSDQGNWETKIRICRACTVFRSHVVTFSNWHWCISARKQIRKKKLVIWGAISNNGWMHESTFPNKPFVCIILVAIIFISLPVSAETSLDSKLKGLDAR